MIELMLATPKPVVNPWPAGIPGPQTIATGDQNIGFFGEVSGTDFITYPDLQTAVGFTTGNAMNPTGGWLKLAYKGNVQFISKLSVRNNVSWAAMNTLGIVSAAQNKLITIKGKVYRLRLINGANVDPYPVNADDATGGPYTTGTEWNHLIYGLLSTAVGAQNLEGPALATYGTTDLGLSPFGNGTSILVKELGPGPVSMVRGNASGAVRGIYRYAALANADTIRGWKPVLEYVSG